LKQVVAQRGELAKFNEYRKQGAELGADLLACMAANGPTSR
jgi:hypothetical protein